MNIVGIDANAVLGPWRPGDGGRIIGVSGIGDRNHRCEILGVWLDAVHLGMATTMKVKPRRKYRRIRFGETAQDDK